MNSKFDLRSSWWILDKIFNVWLTLFKFALIKNYTTIKKIEFKELKSTSNIVQNNSWHDYIIFKKNYANSEDFVDNVKNPSWRKVKDYYNFCLRIFVHFNFLVQRGWKFDHQMNKNLITL